MLSRPQIGPIAFLGISWYGLLIFLGILLAMWVTKREEKRLDMPKDTAIDFALFAIPLGIIGARLYSVLFRLDDYSDDFLRIFNLREGGLAIAGAIIGGMVAALLISRRRRIPFLRICDMVVLGVVLAQAIGRWGNYINIEAYGIGIKDPAWQFFPIGIEVPIGKPIPKWSWHMATFFYESMWDLLVFAALFAMRRKLKRDGDLFCWYVLLYGVGRTVIEGLRTDSLTFMSEFVRISQLICALSCVAVAVYFYLRQRCVRRISGALPHDILLLCSIALGLTISIVGEFERGAYSDLFGISQALVIAMLVVNIGVTILRAVRRCPIHLAGVAQWLMIAFWVIVLLVGIGRAHENNTLYVTLRQLPSMLQIALAGAIFSFAPFPAVRKKRPSTDVERA